MGGRGPWQGPVELAARRRISGRCTAEGGLAEGGLRRSLGVPRCLGMHDLPTEPRRRDRGMSRMPQMRRVSRSSVAAAIGRSCRSLLRSSIRAEPRTPPQVPAVRPSDFVRPELAVEPETQPVERPEPDSAPAVVAVGGGQSVAGQLDHAGAERLRRERHRAPADDRQRRRLALAAVEEIDPDPARRTGSRRRRGPCSRARTRPVRPARVRRTPRSGCRCRSRRPTDG